MWFCRSLICAEHEVLKAYLRGPEQAFMFRFDGKKFAAIDQSGLDGE